MIEYPDGRPVPLDERHAYHVRTRLSDGRSYIGRQHPEPDAPRGYWSTYLWHDGLARGYARAYDFDGDDFDQGWWPTADAAEEFLAAWKNPDLAEDW